MGEFWNESECYDRLLTPPYIQRNVVLYKTIDEPSLTWPAATPIYWKERKFSPGSPKVQLSQDWLRDTNMSAVLFRDTKTWRTLRHVKKLDLYHWKSSWRPTDTSHNIWQCLIWFSFFFFQILISYIMLLGRKLISFFLVGVIATSVLALRYFIIRTEEIVASRTKLMTIFENIAVKRVGE